MTTKEWLLSYTASNSINFDMLYDADDAFNAYGAVEVPAYVIIDQNGQIVFRDSEYYFYRTQVFTDIIDNLLIEQI